MGIIQPLPAATVRLIRAGETIDGVQAIVRELVENALDSGATQITVQYWSQRWQLMVSDNGSGMQPEDLTQAALCHTTSKIHQPEDLLTLSSLGFRGEGLYAISATSELSICSRPVDQPLGWQANYDAQGQVLTLNPCAQAPGTMVSVREILGRVPVRQQSIKLRQQIQQVQDQIRAIALMQPGVSLYLKINDRPRLNFPGVSSLLRRVAQVWELRESDLQAATSGSLALVLGLPDLLSRPRPDRLAIGINGRLIEDPELLYVLQQSLNRTLPKGRFPIALARWQLPTEQVDWNRHPAKMRVHLQDRPSLEAHLQQAVDQALGVLTPRVSPEFWRTCETRALYREDRPLRIRVVTQVQNTYFLAEHPEGLWLIEQHICHERVIFEQLQAQWQLIPHSPVLLSGLRLVQQENLIRLGLDLEPFGDGVWAVRSIPLILQDQSNPTEALLELSFQSDLEQAQVALACRQAVRNGIPLTLTWAQDVVDQWQQTRNPHTCPHGRPIYLALSDTDLGQHFRRRYRICDNSPATLKQRAGLSDPLPPE